MKLNSICSTWSNDRAFSFFQEWHAFIVKEVEGTITAEEALRYTYKLIFKQDLKEIREWGLFTEREGLMQMGRYHFQILWTLPFQFLRDTFNETTRSPVKTLRGYLNWIKNIDSTIHSFDVVLSKKSIKKILNKSIDLIGNLSQEITCRYHADEDCINKYQWLRTKTHSLSTFSIATLITKYKISKPK